VIDWLTALDAKDPDELMKILQELKKALTGC
jgi:hypothetical protein